MKGWYTGLYLSWYLLASTGGTIGSERAIGDEGVRIGCPPCEKKNIDLHLEWNEGESMDTAYGLTGFSAFMRPRANMYVARCVLGSATACTSAGKLRMYLQSTSAERTGTSRLARNDFRTSSAQVWCVLVWCVCSLRCFHILVSRPLFLSSLPRPATVFGYDTNGRHG